MRRRDFACWALLPLTGIGASAGRADSTRRVALVASRFAFSAPEVRAQRGETITFVLSSPDFMHGFSLPELSARIDIPPGKPVELTLRSLPAGRFVYLCDNFCGEGHDRMSGFLLVA